jgi:hypothetical protein
MEVALLRARESFQRVRGQKEVGALTTSSQREKGIRACKGDWSLFTGLHQPTR